MKFVDDDDDDDDEENVLQSTAVRTGDEAVQQQLKTRKWN